MVVARMGCPLLIGFGEGEVFIASDVSAVVSFTRQVTYLEDGDIAILTADGVDTLLDKDGNTPERQVKTSQLSLASLELGPYSHFMQKEINEQPKLSLTPQRSSWMAALFLRTSARMHLPSSTKSTALRFWRVAHLTMPL